MCVMKTKKLSVRLLGGFGASYGDEALTFGKQANAKSVQLFQILMTRPGKDFNKQEIIEQMYGSGETADPNAGFRNALCRLRKYLDASPLPPGGYLVAEEGSIRFEGPVEVESDAWELDRAAQAFWEERDSAKKTELCERACQLYQGDFLPQLSGELWVAERKRYYRNQYFTMLRYRLEGLKERGDYVTVGRLALRAMELEPVGEWLSDRIESLLAQGRRQDAVMAFQTAQNQVKAMGDTAPGELYWRLSEIGQRLALLEGSPGPGSRRLRGRAAPQGTYGSLPGFVEHYRILKQAEKSRAVPFVLLLCTIQDANGNPVNVQKNWEIQGRRLQEAFRRNLRAGDFYEKFNVSQYLLLCVGVEVENVPEIATRIDLDFRKQCYGHYAIHYRLLDNVSAL